MAKNYSNADTWAASNLGVFFTAKSNNTLEDGDLTGQCVSLIKWFLKELTSVPNPGQARGHAKDYGKNLLAQGHATKVSSPIQGDIAVWPQDGGGYGHIAVVLSSNGAFEQNIGGLGSTSKKVIGGYDVNGRPIYITVYSSRIDPLNANWRKGPVEYYRIKTYGGSMAEKVNLDTARILASAALGRDGYDGRDDAHKGQADSDLIANHVGKDLTNQYIMDNFFKTQEAVNAFGTKDAVYTERNALRKRVKELEKQLADKPSGEFVKVLTAGQDFYTKK